MEPFYMTFVKLGEVLCSPLVVTTTLGRGRLGAPLRIGFLGRPVGRFWTDPELIEINYKLAAAQ